MKKISLFSFVELLEKHNLIVEKNVSNKEINYISYNSKDLIGNTLFFCKGATFSVKYLEMAQQNGAVCYIAEKIYNTDSDYIIVSDVRKAMAILSGLFYDNAFDKLNLVGITGTKGKSTTAYYVRYIIDEYMNDILSPKSAIISSIETYDGVVNKESVLTTPEALELHKHFDNAVESGVKYCTMEVSSQALKYDRVFGVHYKIGAYLNFGEDHISSIEHSDIEDYFTSKMRIFELCDIACINLDDQTSERAIGYAKNCKIVTFSQKDSNADFYCYNVKKDGNDITFTVKSKDFEKDFRISMPGLFNVYNALCAIAITSQLGVPVSFMYEGLMKAQVAGRMESYTNCDKKIVTIVDFAHNGMSFEALYKSVIDEYKGRKIVTVFGCPGKKAINRRRDLGTLAGIYSDKVIITEDDFGEEPLLDICNEISKYVKEQNCPFDIIEDRVEAIKKAIFECDGETVLLIAGKGNETKCKRGSISVPYKTDAYYTKQFLREYDIINKIDKTQIINSICTVFPEMKNLSDEKYTQKHLQNLDIIKSIDSSNSVEDIFDIIPVLNKKAGQTVVIKCDGSEFENPDLLKSSLEDIALLSMCNIKIVLVHSGDGNVGTSLVNSLSTLGLDAVSISAKDINLLKTTKNQADSVGMVGEVVSVNTEIIDTLLKASKIPVISPIGDSETSETIDINADDLACEIAKALNADKLIFLTDMDGILLDQNNPATIINSLDISRAKDLIESGFVGGEIISKLSNCVQAVSNGVDCVSIIDGRKQHTILLESLSDKNYGTMIYKTDTTQKA